MKKVSKSLRAGLVRIAPAILSLLFPLLPAPAATYYVSPQGDDDNEGTLAAPWKTVQKAANVMVAGDTACLRAGTYRETVTPVHHGTANKPIRFEAYGSEVAIVSGLDVVNTAWTTDGRKIYSTFFPLNLGDQNQVFIDGAMGDLARWPNNTDGDLFTHNAAAVDSGSLTSITSASLPVLAENAYAGAVVWFSAGVKWTCLGMTVNSSSGTTIHFTNTTDSWLKSIHNPGTAVGGDINYFYLSGLLSLLDAEKEWFYDAALGKLYLRAPGGDSPGNHTVEVKARDVAFNLTTAFINLRKLRIKGAKIVITGSNDILDGITGNYMFHHNARGMTWWYPGLHPNTGAVFVNGANATIKNSNFGYSAGSMIVLAGQSANATVDNNYIHHADYNGSYDAGISGADGTGAASITRNTLYASGRSLIHIGYDLVAPWKIKWNDFSDAMIFTDDGGAFYTNGKDLLGTVVAYNHFHDQTVLNAYGATPGFYVDDWAKNITLHHNVIYNLHTGNTIKVGAGTTGRSIYNITSYGAPSGAFVAYHGGGIASVANLLQNAASANFVDAAGHDFRLAATAAAINAGRVLAPWTDGFAGSAPDTGAYEYGGVDRLARWTTGVGSTIYADIVDPLPPPPPPGIVDDNVTGAGYNQFEYAGDWSTANKTGCYLDRQHLAGAAGDYARIRFAGGRIQVYASRYGAAPNNLSTISIDGGAETAVDYSGVSNYDAGMIYDSGNLPIGSHILTLRATREGAKVDKVEISCVNDLIVDGADATGVTATGTWTVASQSKPSGYFGRNYAHDNQTGKGTKSMRFTPTIPTTGTYEVYGRWVADLTNAANVPFTITHAGGTASLAVDQRTNGGQWVLLGTYKFNAGTDGNVLISNTGTTGYVVADAVRFVATGQTPAPPVVSTATDVSADGPRSGPARRQPTAVVTR